MRENLPLIVGISLPIVFIVLVSLIVFIPNQFITPEHNFLYTTDNSYNTYNNYEYRYVVLEGQVSLEEVQLREDVTPKGERPTLFLYDVTNDTSKQIDFEEAQGFTLDPGPSSPDGYTVSYRSGHAGIFELFGSGNENRGIFITKGGGNKRLDGISDGRSYWSRSNFKLIGWLK